MPPSCPEAAALVTSKEGHWRRGTGHLDLGMAGPGQSDLPVPQGGASLLGPSLQGFQEGWDAESCMASWASEEGASTEDRRAEREGEPGSRDTIEPVNPAGHTHVSPV